MGARTFGDVTHCRPRTRDFGVERSLGVRCLGVEQGLSAPASRRGRRRLSAPAGRRGRRRRLSAPTGRRRWRGRLLAPTGRRGWRGRLSAPGGGRGRGCLAAASGGRGERRGWLGRTQREGGTARAHGRAQRLKGVAAPANQPECEGFHPGATESILFAPGLTRCIGPARPGDLSHGGRLAILLLETGAYQMPVRRLEPSLHPSALQSRR